MREGGWGVQHTTINQKVAVIVAMISAAIAAEIAAAIAAETAAVEAAAANDGVGNQQHGQRWGRW